MKIKRIIGTLQNIIFFVIASFALSSVGWAATYYVATNGYDGNPGTLANPWQSIGKANSTLAPGDTVYIRGGTYSSDYINPNNTGTSDTNRITYTNYNGENVTVRDAAYGVNINGKSYITVNGINFYNLDHFLYISNGSRNIISYCTFDLMRTYTWHGSRIYNNSQYNWLHHTTFSRWGYYTSDDQGALIDIGTQNTTADNSFYNLLEDNTFSYGGHHILGLFSRYTVVRNNYFHNEEWSNCSLGTCGDRNITTSGAAAGNNLIENNRIAFAGKPPDDNGAVGLDLRSPENIVRFNSFYGNKAAGIGCNIQYAGNPPDRNHIYSNTFFNNGYDPRIDAAYRYGMYFANWNRGNPIENVLKNNVFHANENGGIYFMGVPRSLQTVENNWEESGDPLFVNIENSLDPMNHNLPDLHLQNYSPLIDAGAWLTTITTSGSGSSFQVEDAKYFMDGWGIIEGDLIQLQGQTQNLRIININYNNNTISVDQNMSTYQGQGVSLAYQGSAPDIGAYEYTGTYTPDTEAPRVPSGIIAEIISSTQINLSWNASTDNVGITGYRIYQDGSLIVTSASTTYSDTGLSPSNTYTYTIKSFDAANNESAESAPVSATTLDIQIDSIAPSPPLNFGSVQN